MKQNWGPCKFLVTLGSVKFRLGSGVSEGDWRHQELIRKV